MRELSHRGWNPSARLGSAAGILTLYGLAIATGVLVAYTDPGLVIAAFAGFAFLAFSMAKAAPKYMLALAIVPCVIAVGPLAGDPNAGALSPSSLRLPLLLLCCGLIVITHRRRSPMPPVVIALHFALVLVLLAGLLFSPDPDGGIQYVLKLWVPIGVAYAIASLGSEGVRFAEIAALLALGVTLAADYVMLSQGAGYYLQSGTTFSRFGGISGSGPSTGFVLSLLGTFALVVWLRSGRRIGLVLWAASFPILLITLTRSGIGAWLVGSLAALLIARRFRLTVAVAAVAMIALVTNSALADRSTSSKGGGWTAVVEAVRENGLAGISTTGRSDLWRESIDRFRDRPVAGNGPGAAEHYTRALTDGSLGQAHSEYLTLLVAGGVIGFGLWAVMWAALARGVIRGSGRLSAAPIIAYALLCAVDSPIENYAQGGVMIGLAVGWALAAQASDPEGDREPVDDPGVDFPQRATRR